LQSTVTKYKKTIMLINHLKIALRNIRKFGLRSFIHVIGLSIGIAACFIVFNLVRYEFSYDTFHKDLDQIYRINTLSSNGQEEWPTPGSPIPLVEAVRNEMTAVEVAAPIFTAYRFLVESGDKADNFGVNEKVAFVDKNYFNLFEYTWLAGSAATALDKPSTVVLTQRAANKYFGEKALNDIIGSELIYTDTLKVVVTGVVADLDQRSDLIFTDFISYASLLNNADIRAQRNVDNWNSVSSSAQLFVKLIPNKSNKAQSELIQITDKYLEEDGDWHTSFSLEPLSEMHFSSTFDGHKADKSILRGLAFIGFFILIIACINFINLETAQAKLRAKEVGIRKTLGSSRKQLISQFLLETYIIIIIAILGAILLSQLAANYFQQVLPSGFSFDYLNLNNLLFLLGLSMIVLLLSGFYPSSILSAYSPIKAIQDKARTANKFSFQYFLRKNLIVFQFGSSIAFIIIVLAINAQIDFLMNKEVGFNKEAVMHIDTPFQGTLDKTKLLKSKLATIAGVESVSLSSDMLISGALWTSTVEHEFKGEKEEVSIQVKTADPSFLGLYQVPIVAGRGFTLDKSEVVINEAALNILGLQSPEEAIGKALKYDNDLTIVGVIPSIHTQAMYEAIRPMMLGYNERNLYKVNVRLAPNVNIANTVQSMQEAYSTIYPNETYEFKFLDETIKNFYTSEVRLRRVLFFATVIAILISCLGLFGLASFTIAERTKEISIRKVLGAPISSILILLSKEYALLIGLSFLLAIYPAWYFIANWLSSFQFKMDMPIGIYIVAGLIAFILSIGIVSLHALKAANRNPAQVLKDE
jgi:putative ABC transport system permease protein